MLTITATGRYSKCVSNEVITAGSVGIPAVFNLNEDFDGLSPIAVFRGSGVSFDAALIGSEVIVPHEVLANVGGILEVGVYARNGEGTIVIPTVWSVAGTIREGAIASGVDPSEPTPDWTAQVQAAASEAVQTANDAKDIAEDAKEVAITSADSAQRSAVSANNSAARSSAAANAAERARDSAERYRDDTLTYSVMADESASNAHTYAQNAETSARGAAGSADVATQKEAAASEAATNAARSEESAFNSAKEATDASDNAEQAAEQASLSAGRAYTSSQNAAESARLAALSETAASTSALTANEAKIASETAQSEAEAAKVAAERAKNRSEELYDYVTEANRSATEAAALAVAAKTDAETAAESATESAAIVQEVADRLPTIEENLDIAKTTANDARITLFDGTPLVDYAVRDLNYTGTPGTADSTCLGVKRRGSRIVLNGGNISNASKPNAFVKLTGNTTGRTNNSSTVRAWSDGITLKNGRTYRVTVIYISGETTSENAPPAVTVSVYNLGESSTIGYGKRDENNRYIRYFKATGEVNLALFVPCYQVTYTDYTVDVILEEVDETIGEYLPSMVANGALAVDDFVIVDNELFRITAPVASGGSLIIGTNCEKVTITKTLSRQINETNELKDDVSDAQAMIATVEADSTASKEYAVGDLLVFEGKLYQAVSAISLGDTLIPDGNIELTTVEQQLASSGGGAVEDVQINGTSIVQDGVANVPVANSNMLGVIKVNSSYGIALDNGGTIYINNASESDLKAGTNTKKSLTSSRVNIATFYGLAKAAGDTTQSQSSNAVGTYTENAKSAIHEMLNGLVEVTGTTPVITALPGISYKCGEVSTLDVTLPASGCIDVIFESGSTPTVLTVTPPTGVTVKWANGFDPTALEADTTYEINICDGLGVAAAWT